MKLSQKRLYNEEDWACIMAKFCIMETDLGQIYNNILYNNYDIHTNCMCTIGDYFMKDIKKAIIILAQ